MTRFITIDDSIYCVDAILGKYQTEGLLILTSHFGIFCRDVIFLYVAEAFLAYILLTHLQGRKFYESALRLEPGCLGAVLALADLNAAEGRNEEAITLLQRYLKNWADDSLHSKLAQILALSNKLGESLSHYQTALRFQCFSRTSLSHCK